MEEVGGVVDGGPVVHTVEPALGLPLAGPLEVGVPVEVPGELGLLPPATGLPGVTGGSARLVRLRDIIIMKKKELLINCHNKE